MIRSACAAVLLLFAAGAGGSGPLPTAPGSGAPSLTADEWREDLAFAARDFLARDLSFAPADRKRFAEAIDTLAASLGQRSGEQVVVELARAVALAGNAHTRLYILRNRGELRRYPVRLWWFGDELRVLRAAPGQEALVGARVTRIAGRPVRDLRREVAPLFAGNGPWTDYMSTYSMTSPDVLIGMGRVGDDGRARIDYVGRDGSAGARTLEPMPLERLATPTEAWWDLAPERPRAEAGWAHALTTAAPLYLQDTERGYWARHLAADRIYYVQYNRADNTPGRETLTAFSARVGTDLERLPLRALAIDLRFNTGGNLDVGAPVLDALIAAARARGIAVYGLIGRATFSAGLYHALQLRAAGARLVGEAPGDGLQYWAEGGNLPMPRSRLTLHFADRFHNYARHDRPELDAVLFQRSRLRVDSAAPDIKVATSWRQYVAGRDPVLDAVRRHAR